MENDLYDRLYKKLKKIESDEEKRLKENGENQKRYHELMDARIEHNGAVSFAIVKGLEKGKEDGKREMRIEIASKMLKADMANDVIIEMTSLSENEINHLKEKIKDDTNS
ncbi:MAG: hypothetical protein JW702_00355 [Clostridiales bacterium]|nr:hypothetical protein [Clostridiales bacterium]